MKKLIIILIIGALAPVLRAQQLPLYSQYMMNGFLLNPAIAGSVPYAPVCITARQQWVGIKSAPQTFAISGHTVFGPTKREGVGGYIFSDRFGPVTRLGILASYAHHIKVDSKGGKLALGISLSGYQYVLDETQLKLYDNMQDNAYTGSKESVFVPDANFGVFYYNENYYGGLSVAQLFQWNIKMGTTSSNQLVRHYFATGGYRFTLNKDFKLEPSVLLKFTESSPAQVDINVKGYYQKNYWFGISYRTDNSAIAMLGMKYKNMYFGYAFDYTLSKISDYSSGSHEIMIGINIGERENTGSSLL